MLFIISSDPRTSHRAAEAVRVAAGLAAIGQQEISVCFSQAAALIVSQSSQTFVDGDVIQKHLPLLAQHAQAIWVESGDPFLEGDPLVPLQRLGLTELAEKAANSKGVLRF